jgi:hypothetical protein
MATDPQDYIWMNRIAGRVMGVLSVMFGALFFLVGAHIALYGPHDMDSLSGRGVVFGPLVIYFGVGAFFANPKSDKSIGSRTPGALLRRFWPFLAGGLVFEAVVLTAWTIYLHQHGFTNVWID